MPMLVKYKLILLLAAIQAVRAESPINGVRPSNVLGGLEQHASFSFVRPGLTQTAFAFNGPSSHQAFSSSVGDPHLAQRVLPSVANALAYRNPGLGYSAVSPITTAYAASPHPTTTNPALTNQQQQYDYQQQQALALAYQQQLQQYQQYQRQQQQQIYSGYNQQIQSEPIDAVTQQNVEQQAHLARLIASRFAGSQAQAVASETEQNQLQHQQQQQVQQQNLLGVAYSAAPSVARVKVNGNGYKFDF